MTDVHLLLLLLLFRKLYYLIHWDNYNYIVHETAAVCSWQRTPASLHSHLSKYFYHLHHDINLFIRMLKEYQDMIYIKLRSVNLPAAVTKSPIKEVPLLFIWLINMKEVKFLGWNLFPKLITETRKNDMWYRCGQIVVKQIINLTNRRLHCLINKTGNYVRIT